MIHVQVNHLMTVVKDKDESRVKQTHTQHLGLSVIDELWRVIQKVQRFRASS